MNYLLVWKSCISTCTVPSPYPRPKRVLSFIFVPTVFFSTWPIIYARISLLCDFHFLFHIIISILSNLGTLPCLALSCSYFFSYLKYDSASVEDNFYKIILVLCFLLWRYPSPLFNTQVIWISVCLALHVSTAFLRLHTKSNWWLFVSRWIHRLRQHLTSIIAKFWPHKILQILKHTCMPSFLLSRLLLIYYHKW